MMKTANIKHSRICAFCKFWYDPANAAIAPRNPVGGFWDYNDQVWNVCTSYGSKRRAGAGCNRFECKLEKQ